MNPRDLIINPKSVGEHLLLVDIMPAYEYKEGKRTESVTGHRYVVTMPEKRFEKIGVRIDGPKLVEKFDGNPEVRFTDLELALYFAKGEYQVSAKAKGIALVGAKS